MTRLQTVVQWMRRRRVAVLKGGWSNERPISLNTGKAIEAALRRNGVSPLSIDVQPNIVDVLRTKKVTFVFNALHGAFGEDGTLQNVLDLMRIPYTGSGALASALAMNKHVAKELFVAADVPTAPWVTLYKKRFESAPPEALKRIRARFGSRTLFIKPVDGGSALGASRADQPRQVSAALRRAFATSGGALVEPFIAGRELTVGILGARDLPVVEIIPKHAFYDFHSKYARGGSAHLAPAPLPASLSRALQRISRRAFDALGCTVYGRVDILLTKNNRPFVLEVNTIPGMTPTSLLPDAARAAGIAFDRLVLEIASESLRGIL